MSTATTPRSRRFVTLATAAEHVDVTERTIRAYISQGQLTGYRLGKRAIRIDLDELESMMTVIPTVGGDAR